VARDDANSDEEQALDVEADLDRSEQPREASREASWDEIVDIFSRAMELPQAARTGFLDIACAGRAGLRSEVEAMLASAGDSRARARARRGAPSGGAG
jgi:hypothetical protein